MIYIFNHETGEIKYTCSTKEQLLRTLRSMVDNGYNLCSYTLKDSSGRNIKASNINLD